MYTVQKSFGWNNWKNWGKYPSLERAISACLYYENLRCGRIVDNNGNIVFEDIVRIPQQAVSDQFGFVGYQAK
jgi:hypothetical protein